jgi:hypothetical protein
MVGPRRNFEPEAKKSFVIEDHGVLQRERLEAKLAIGIRSRRKKRELRKRSLQCGVPIRTIGVIRILGTNICRYREETKRT